MIDIRLYSSPGGFEILYNHELENDIEQKIRDEKFPAKDFPENHNRA